MNPSPNPFLEWQNFYIVIGSAAGALTGLQFVVMALIADMPMTHGDEVEAGEAFATPTIVHFVATLLFSATLVIPWRNDLVAAAIVLSAGGLGGTIYTTVVTRRMSAQKAYRPVLEDWAFHAALPLLAYTGWIGSAICIATAWLNNNSPAASRSALIRGSLFGLAAVSILLLVTGIHNAWDNVTFLVARRRAASGQPSQKPHPPGH